MNNYNTKIYQKLHMAAIIGMCVLLTACNNVPLKHNSKYNIETIELERQLANSADSIQRNLGTLAMLQESKAPPLLNTAPLVTPEGGLGACADIDWTGPIEPLVHKVAEMSNYRVKILGNEPAIPVIISISQEKIVLADILKNAGLQAGRRANLYVFPANKVIEIRYESTN